MRIRNNNDLDVEATAGETITVTKECVLAECDVWVNKTLLEGSEFTLGAEPDPTQVAVAAVYSSDSGGSCKVTLTSDQGGDTPNHPMTQSPNEVRDSVIFTIDIV